MDRLDIMLTAQRDLQERWMGYSFSDMNLAERIEYVKNMVLALNNEVNSELLGEVSWKPWTHGDPYINVDAYKGELVDAWHFLMNLMLAVDMTAEELFVLYVQKREVNARRQREGYDGRSTKCPGCQRAQDDPTTGCYPGNPDVSGTDGLPWCDTLKKRIGTTYVEDAVL